MDPLLVQTHIPHTGGTALRRIVEANYRAEEVVHVEGLGVGEGAVEGATDPRSALARAWRNYYESLPDAERGRLRCFCGHQAPFLIDAVADRPVRAFCMLRDPVDRVLSAYFFMLSHAARLPPASPAVQNVEAFRARGWGLKEVYTELGGSTDWRAELPELDEVALWVFPLAFFNGQSRYLLIADADADLPLEPDREEARAYRDRVEATLSRRYVVGTQDRFSESVRLFADSFGWRRVFEPRTNVGRLRRRGREAEIDEETLSLIRAHNRLDVELHARYSERLAGLPAAGRGEGLGVRARGLASKARARLTGKAGSRAG